MHISEVQIYNYKNYLDTKVQFSEGLNVIVGPNNSGKSNLLECVGYINKRPESNIDHFNKFVLYSNFNEFKKDPPEIEIDYTIEHEFSYDSEDSALSKLKPFIIYNKDANLQELDSGNIKIKAKVKLKYQLDKTYLNDYLIEMKDITCYEKFFNVLKRYEKKYSWNYYKALADEVVQDREVNDIFEVDTIPANRIIDDIEERSKSYVNSKIKENEIPEVQIQQEITTLLREKLINVSKDINDDINKDQDKIGITDGKNNFNSDFVFDKDLALFFKYNLINEKQLFDLPLHSNGLGYNNLIYIRNLIKQKKDNDYNILMIEEPEAHLHPNMQYKLLKYLNSLETIKTEDSDRSIKNQILISTHSPNISASVDMNKIIILNYDTELGNVTASRLSDNFDVNKVSQILDIKEIAKDEGLEENKIKEDLTAILERSKKHLRKFLDITRSDILFSDKIILVEGLSEKLVLPYLHEELVDRHVKVIEVAGINFNHFLPLIFFTNKKILCVTDKDYDIFDETNGVLIDKKTYLEQTKHISYIFKYCNDRVRVSEQTKYGSTFEKELFIENYQDENSFKILMSLTLPKACEKLLDKQSIKVWFNKCETEISDNKTSRVIKKELDKYWLSYKDAQGDNKKVIEMLFFTNLFYRYVKNKKGNFCLDILDLLKNGIIKEPEYLTKEIKWIIE